MGAPARADRCPLNVAVYFPSGVRVLAEFAYTWAVIERGLMYRWSVPDGTGMLFDMGHLAVHRFWMKDTLVPLDMVFIAPNWVVVGIVPNTVPHDVTLRGVDALSRYVLEVPGGWCARNGVDRGQIVTVALLPS